MGKMIGYVEGADVLLIISLLIFLAVFVVAIAYMFSLSKKQYAELSNLPFEQSNNENNEE